MARSFRLRPFVGITVNDSDKYDKRLANRRLRRVVREHIFDEIYQLYTVRDVSNVWTFNKDGKMILDTAMYPHLMRK